MGFIKRNIWLLLGYFQFVFVFTNGILLSKGIVPNHFGWGNFVFIILCFVFLARHSTVVSKRKELEEKKYNEIEDVCEKASDEDMIEDLIKTVGVQKVENAIRKRKVNHLLSKSGN